ncbi:MAG: hypothetical protein ACLT3D_03335 [Lawsonibacter sp.]
MPTYLQGLTIGLAYVAPIGMQNLFVINSALTQPRRRALLTALIGDLPSTSAWRWPASSASARWWSASTGCSACISDRGRLHRCGSASACCGISPPWTGTWT